MSKIGTSAEWLTFEVDQWREAVQHRGLLLTSLESDQQKPVSEAIAALSTAKLLAEPPRFVSGHQLPVAGVTETSVE